MKGLSCYQWSSQTIIAACGSIDTNLKYLGLPREINLEIDLQARDLPCQTACYFYIFQPIHYSFNFTLSQGVIPSEWKIHHIVPVFKSGDKSLVQNYRPISLLCNISKIPKHIFNYLFVSSSISHCQFGFLCDRSTI